MRFFYVLIVCLSVSCSALSARAELGPREERIVTKVIDGDTIIVQGGDTVRLIGIDCDERDYPCYEPAKKRIEELVLGKKVFLEADSEDKDQYQRFLRYVFLDGENICVRMVQEGLAVARFSVQNAKYRAEIAAAEEEAITNKIGCKWGGQSFLPQSRVSAPVAAVKDAIPASEARFFIGQTKTIYGRIANGYESKKQNVFLNFDRAYPDHTFTAVIFASSREAFPSDPVRAYAGKTVRVTGRIKEYRGGPEIVLEDPAQITINEE